MSRYNERIRSLSSPEVRALQDQFYATADSDERAKLAAAINMQLWEESKARMEQLLANKRKRPAPQRAPKPDEVKMEGHHPWK